MSYDNAKLGDRVRVTSPDGEVHEAKIVGAEYDRRIGESGHHLAYYMDNGWTLEILEEAPHPLPVLGGIYTVGYVAKNKRLFANWDGVWHEGNTSTGGWSPVSQRVLGLLRMWHKRGDLLRLVGEAVPF